MRYRLTIFFFFLFPSCRRNKDRVPKAEAISSLRLKKNKSPHSAPFRPAPAASPPLLRSEQSSLVARNSRRRRGPGIRGTGRAGLSCSRLLFHSLEVKSKGAGLDPGAATPEPTLGIWTRRGTPKAHAPQEVTESHRARRASAAWVLSL